MSNRSMSQIANGHNINFKTLNVSLQPCYISRGNDTKTTSVNGKSYEERSVLKPSAMKSYHYNEENGFNPELPTCKGTTNRVTFLRTYKVIYLGCAVLDRRYTLPMLPWIIAEIRKHGSQNMEDIFIEVVEESLKAVNCKSEEIVFEHKLQTISKFGQSSNDKTCFTYVTREVVDGPCAFHVFQASDVNTIYELFTTIREATKEMSSNLIQDPSVTRPSLLDTARNNCQQYEVLYLGRIKLSSKRASPAFIDDAVEKFRIYEAEKTRNSQNGVSPIRTRHGSGTSVSSLPHNLNLGETRGGKEPDKMNSSSCGNDSSNSVDPNKLDVFNQICCDNYSEGFVHSPLSPMCPPDQLRTFYSLNQSSSFNGQDQLHSMPSPHLQKERRNFLTPNSLMPPSSLITHTQSLDVPGCANIVRDLRDSDPNVMGRDRVRSCSGDIPRTKQTSLPTFRQRLGSCGEGELIRPRAYTSPNPSRTQQNRTMLFIIGSSEICLIGMDKKQVLLNRTFNEISCCAKGMKHVDHFGFISHETSLTGADLHAGYIFRCQTTRLVEEIMSTLKLAFQQAQHNFKNLQVKNPKVPKLVICDTCPMHWFHVLCSDIEGLNPDKMHMVILENLGALQDSDKEDIMVKFQKTVVCGIQEQNEILMMLLREYCEQKQSKHTHVLNSSSTIKNEVAFIKEKYSKLDSFRQKAKKSLSSSFETILKLTNRDDGKEVPPSSMINTTKYLEFSVSEDDETFHKDPDTRSYREGSYSEELSSADRLSPLLTRPRSSTFSSPREKITVTKKTTQPQETPKKRPIIDMFIKSGLQSRTPSPPSDSPKGSWRQAIFHRVQTPVNKKKGISRSDSNSSEDGSKTQIKKTKDELRALWKKAIIEQILLIRMEKENKKLQVNQDAATHKRMKLNYKEITPCLKTSVVKWEELINKRYEVTRATLTDMVKSGIPRHKRGEIWQYLAEYNENGWNNSGSTDNDLSLPYDDLLKQLTSHQHSILIDIGRTFPNHPFYSQSLGSGQLSLFNLLKAYSLLDKEVGYCQGLSFVAGILLLHMPEDRAFTLMKYLMFSLGLRRQYKTDMVAFQIQMYQLSRLIHDNYRDLYDHLEKYDIAPTLYAAPWFLTLFASQFPVGFVARLFDLLFLSGMDVVFKVSLMLLGNYKNDILSCDSFESIMEFLKTVLPSIDVLQMEIIFNQVFTLDIGRQLHSYEVEYHVLLEEMIHSPSKSNAELENLQTANKNLKAQNTELMEQLQVAYSRIHNLESSEASLKSSVGRLEARVTSLEDEKEALEYSIKIMRKRLQKFEVARIEEGSLLEEEQQHPPPFGVVYALAGSEKEEDERFKKLMKRLSLEKEPEKGESSDKADENTHEDPESAYLAE